MRGVGRSHLGGAHSEVELSTGSGVTPESATHKIMSPSALIQTSGSIDIHVDRFGLDLIHSPSSVGVFEAEVAT